ncbi:MAG: DUF4878 domain-containing protein [Rikenellaceae bacterium]|nr:DUF4878 domain-containing protein [Rikenellaceae bacterium]
MKKIFAICALFVAVMMVSCGGGAATPSDVAAKVYDMIIDGDYEGAVDCFYFGEDETKAEQMRTMVLSMLQEKAAPQIEAKGGLKAVEVIGEEIAEDGKTAKVEVKLIYGNGKEENNKLDMAVDPSGKWCPSVNK